MASSNGSFSENGSASGPAHHDEHNHTTAAPAPQHRRRNVLNDAASLIGTGGLGHPSQHTQSHTPPEPRPQELNEVLDLYEKQFLPHQPRSLSGIALRSFLLGISLCFSSILSLYLLYTSNPLWRAPFFLTTLSTFHFLEFYTTSLTNTHSAKISSFLLSSNGSAYTIAHTASFTECILSHLFLPQSLQTILPAWVHYIILFLGLLFIFVGQCVRAEAMLEAGSNFSHLVRHTKAPSHQLVTTGLYSHFRHPSYFGFFWWGIGTQLVCGNIICLLGYAVVLWRFFSRRIDGEEELLVRFFGDEYVQYRKKTRVGIPFIG